MVRPYARDRWGAVRICRTRRSHYPPPWLVPRLSLPRTAGEGRSARLAGACSRLAACQVDDARTGASCAAQPQPTRLATAAGPLPGSFLACPSPELQAELQGRDGRRGLQGVARRPAAVCQGRMGNDRRAMVAKRATAARSTSPGTGEVGALRRPERAQRRGSTFASGDTRKTPPPAARRGRSSSRRFSPRRARKRTRALPHSRTCQRCYRSSPSILFTLASSEGSVAPEIALSRRSTSSSPKSSGLRRLMRTSGAKASSTVRSSPPSSP